MFLMIVISVFHLLTKFTNGEPVLLVVANKSFLISVTWAYTRDVVMTIYNQIYPVDCKTAMNGNITLD